MVYYIGWQNYARLWIPWTGACGRMAAFEMAFVLIFYRSREQNHQGVIFGRSSWECEKQAEEPLAKGAENQMEEIL